MYPRVGEAHFEKEGWSMNDPDLNLYIARHVMNYTCVKAEPKLSASDGRTYFWNDRIYYWEDDCGPIGNFFTPSSDIAQAQSVLDWCCKKCTVMIGKVGNGHGHDFIIQGTNNEGEVRYCMTQDESFARAICLFAKKLCLYL